MDVKLYKTLYKTFPVLGQVAWLAMPAVGRVQTRNLRLHRMQWSPSLPPMCCLLVLEIVSMYVAATADTADTAKVIEVADADRLKFDVGSLVFNSLNQLLGQVTTISDASAGTGATTQITLVSNTLVTIATADVLSVGEPIPPHAVGTMTLGQLGDALDVGVKPTSHKSKQQSTSYSLSFW